MLFFEELDGALAKICYLAYLPLNFSRVFAVEFGQDFWIGVGVGVEDVEAFLRVLVFSEDQINPKVQIFTNVVAFQCCTHGHHELFRAFGPGRKLDIAHVRSALLFAQLYVCDVSEEGRHVVELRYALFDVRSGGLAVKTVPDLFDGAE